MKEVCVSCYLHNNFLQSDSNNRGPDWKKLAILHLFSPTALERYQSMKWSTVMKMTVTVPPLAVHLHLLYWTILNFSPLSCFSWKWPFLKDIYRLSKKIIYNPVRTYNIFIKSKVSESLCSPDAISEKNNWFLFWVRPILAPFFRE